MSEQKIDDCPLCDAVVNTPLVRNGVNVNAILARNDDFLVVPALGPLIPGHVLVVSADHSEGVRFLSVRLRSAYAAFSAELRGYCSRVGDTMLEAEHGASRNSTRGPCIRHAHVHVLPGLGDIISVFDNRPSLNPAKIERTSSRIDPYLWINNGASQRLYHAPMAPGQEIRRTVGTQLAIDDWDWALNPKAAIIARTIEYWSDL
jgi:diadenosine tetraphosphate (Ap4A) HIT family hydrolase